MKYNLLIRKNYNKEDKKMEKVVITEQEASEMLKLIRQNTPDAKRQALVAAFAAGAAAMSNLEHKEPAA